MILALDFYCVHDTSYSCYTAALPVYFQDWLGPSGWKDAAETVSAETAIKLVHWEVLALG